MAEIRCSCGHQDNCRQFVPYGEEAGDSMVCPKCRMRFRGPRNGEIGVQIWREASSEWAAVEAMDIISTTGV